MARQIGSYVLDLSTLLSSTQQTEIYPAKHVDNPQPLLAQLLPKTAFKNPFAQADLVRTVQNYRHVHSDKVLTPVHYEETKIFMFFMWSRWEDGLERALEGRVVGQAEAAGFMREIGVAMFQMANQGLWHPLFGPKSIVIHQGSLKLLPFDLDALLSPLINEYSAPETIANNTVNYKSNVWSFGMLFYRMLYGLDIRPSCRQEFYQILKRPAGFPEGANARIAQLIRGCLVFDAEQRFGWEDVFSHPVWEGYFHELLKTRNLAQSKLKFLIRRLRESVTKHNLNIELIFQHLNPASHDELPKEQFLYFLKCLDQDLSDWEANYVFTKFDIDGNGAVSVSELKQWMFLHEIRMTALKPPEHVADREEKMVGEVVAGQVLLNRAMNVVKAVRFHLVQKRINLRSMFSLFEKERAIGYENYCSMLRVIDPSLTAEDLRASFTLFDWNKDGIIQYEQFEQTLTRVAGFPLNLF